MDDATRERLEREHRPELFENCTRCGEGSVRVGTHVCDPTRKQTYEASLIPAYEPNEEMIRVLESRLLSILMKHRIVATSRQLRDLALAVEPLTGGPIG